MTESVKDILESYDLEDEASSTLGQIHRANENGVSRRKATPALVVNTIHHNTYKTWTEICSELGVNSDKLLDYRKELIRSGIIESKVQNPSKLVQGKPHDLLSLAENAHADIIFDGTNPNSWVAGVIYLDEWMNLRETPISEVAQKYACDRETVSDIAGRLARLDVFSRAYATGRVNGALGALLARRRHTKETLRRSLSETTKDVSDRLRALEKHGEWQLNTTEFAGKTFYWTSE